MQVWVADIDADGAAAVAREIEEQGAEGKAAGASATPYTVGGRGRIASSLTRLD